MADPIIIEAFSGQSPDLIFNLILPIQQEEFGILVTRKDQPDLEDIKDFYQKDAGNFWVALDRDEVIGTVALKDIGNRHVALRKMFVHKDYRGRERGVALQLLNVALAFAKQSKVTDIFLGTTSKFLAAHRFYEKNGFKEIIPASLPPGFPIMKVDVKFYRYRIG